jgi:hypothetical protein
MWRRKFLRLFSVIIFTLLAACGFAQQSSSPATATTQATQPLSGGQQQHQASTSPASRSGSKSADAPIESGATQAVPASKQQPQRILGIMPNYRAVSAGAVPPPPTPKEAFKIATQNSFDYSSFAFVGITSLLAEGTNAHPQLGKGIGGFGQYYWRGLLDKTDGNYMVIFALPTIFHQDERYYAKSKGSLGDRAIYAATRALITPNYQGQSTFNTSEVLGRGIAEAISASYYPSGSRTFGDIAVKYGWAVGRDSLTNVFREFWPDIATHVLHREP